MPGNALAPSARPFGQTRRFGCKIQRFAPQAMAKPSSRGPAPGPTIIRQLAHVAGTPLPASSPSVPDRLSEWFDWNRAVALQSALDGRLPPAADNVQAFDAEQQADCARRREELATSIEHMEALLADADLEACCRHYLSTQRSLQAAAGRLRGRLRDMLVQAGPAQARLAEVDALLEQVLGPRESFLLARIPQVLKQQADRAGDTAGTGTPAATTPPHSAFVRHLQALLRSELELRFHPIDGLLAALRTH